MPTSYGPSQLVQYVSVKAPTVRACGPVTCVHGSKWPTSYSVLMLYAPGPHGTMLLAAALEYSGWKLNGVPGSRSGWCS